MSGERDLRKRLVALERRFATLIMSGTAEGSDGAKTKVRFDDEGADGKPFSSPLLAQVNSAGKKGGGVSRFTRIGDGEPVFVINPGGEIGEHSRVMPAGHVGDHPSPGSASQDGDVMSIGDVTVAIRNGLVELSQGSASIRLTGGVITLKASAIRLERG